MFQLLYELLCGENMDPTYVSDIYPSVGLFTLILSVVLCAIFYLALGRWKPIWDKLFHWIITILLLIGISVYFALSQAKGMIGAEDFDAYMIKFSLVNALFATIYFVLLSLLMKKASIFAKRTPF